MLDGKLMTDGTVIARFNSDLMDNFTVKTTAQVQYKFPIVFFFFSD